MAQYSNLKAYIEEKIYENGTQAITGDILQDVLKVMTDDLGEFYQMGGVASPSTDPGTPDAKVIYFATEAGTYTNFGGITLAAGEVALLIFETSWTKETLNVLSAANGGVKTANLADGAVTTEKIAGGAVETAKIANNAVTSGKVADGAIGTAKIADAGVTADKIAANAVETAKIKNGAVTEGKINDGAVTAGKVAANAVTTAKIADDAVTTAKLNDGAVTEDKIATDAVTSGKVKDGAISTAKIAAGAVTHAKIGAGAVEESNIKDGAVTSDKIANGAVGSDQLAEGAFSAQNLADGSVTTDKLADDAVIAEKIADGAVTADKFANGSVTTIKLGSGAVTTEKIGDGMVTRQKLADSSVGTSKIIDEAVTTDKVADGAITDAKLENPVSVSQNTETGKTELLIGDSPALIVDNEPEAGSDNLVKSGGVKRGILVNDYFFVGQGSTLVWSDKIDVLAGHVYRIFVKNPNVDLSGITGGYIFGLNVTKDISSAPVKVAYSSGVVLREYYDIVIPANADTLYIGGRCAADVKSVFCVEDITVCSELDDKIDEEITRAQEAEESISNRQKESSLLRLTQSDTYAASGDYIHLQPSSSWYGTKVKCAVGDKFVVKGVGGSGYRLYYTCDYAGKIIRTAAASLNTLNNGMVLTIEEGEEWLVMNTNNANSSLERTTTNNAIKEFADESYRHINECSNYTAFKYRGLIDNNGVNDSTNVTYLRTGFINVSGLAQGSTAKKVQFKCYYNSFSNVGGLFCYNPRHEYLGKYTGGVTTANEEPYISGEIGLADLPENTAYIRMFKLYNGDGYCIGAYEDGLHFADIVFAAADSTDEARMSADIVSSDINNINTAINSLHSKGGGTILLRNGTYSTDSTTVRLTIYDDVHIVGETAEKTIIRSNSSADVTFVNCINGIISNVNIRKYYIPETGVKVLLDNVIVNSERITGYAEYYRMIAAPNSSDADKAIADRVINDGDNMPEIISDALTRYHNVRLLAGSYTLGANAVQISVDNCHLKGMGSNKVYVYRTGGEPAIVTTAAVTGTVIEHITTPTTICIGNEGAHSGKIIDCDIKTAGGNTKHINSVSIGTHGLNIIEVGLGKDMESLLGAKSLIDDATNPATDVRNRIVLYGHVKETTTAPLYWDKTLELFGATDNAEIEIECTTAGYSGFTIRDGGAIHPTPNYSHFRDITIHRSGECPGYQFAAVDVMSAYCLFENVVFKNSSSCPDAYSPGTDDNTLRSGDRRHGVLVSIWAYDENCKTEFHHCKGIGSPYGFKNTRGWYIKGGSPKLYDCIGYGSGIGRRGYGVVCHASSKPYIYNSVFFGSPYGWGLNNGIQFQAASQAVLVGCIGFAGNGYQYISNGGTDIVNQGTLCEASHGIGCLMSVTPRLVNCQAFAGDADGSSAVYTDNLSAPEIIGGYYGKDTKVYADKYAVDSGSTYMTLTDFGNDARNIDVKYIYLRDMSGNNVSNIAKIEIRAGNTVIAETTFHTTEITMDIVNKRVAADAVVTCHVLDANGNDISTGVSFDIFTRYKVANSMSCVLIQGASHPTIHKAVFEGNDESDGVVIDTTAIDYLIEDCTIDIPATKKVVKATSTKSNVPIVNCLFKSQLTENIDSFASVTQLGSNSVL